MCYPSKPRQEDREILYLGIDQHRKQLTVSARNEAGDVTLRQQVSTGRERVRAFIDELRTGSTAGFSNSAPVRTEKGSELPCVPSPPRWFCPLFCAPAPPAPGTQHRFRLDGQFIIWALFKHAPRSQPPFPPIPLGRFAEAVLERSGHGEAQLLRGGAGRAEPVAGGDFAGLVEVHKERVAAEPGDGLARPGHHPHQRRGRGNHQHQPPPQGLATIRPRSA